MHVATGEHCRKSKKTLSTGTMAVGKRKYSGWVGAWQLLWMLGDHLLNMVIAATNTPKSTGNTVASEQAVWPKEKEFYAG